ncbi:MAG: hypothetical protein AB1918_11860 [Pseudomonadota bacterium]
MGFNPFDEKGMPIDKQLHSWKELNVKPYDKYDVDPYTRCRVIAMNGVEVEAALFGHQFARHTVDIELKRQLALVRRAEQQQQKMVNWLIPGQESTIEVTIGYEQVAVDLTAWICQNEPDPYARQVYEFGLLEDFDHLYRYANLLDMMEGRKAADIVGRATEITPGRPTAIEHRHPHDDVRKSLDRKTAQFISLMNALTITAAEQQTLNFYMNVGNRPTDPVARGLYLEIAQIEEQHVTQYECLNDPSASWAEMLVLHEYNECYLYHSFMLDEPDPRIRKMWENHLAMEVTHLQMANELLKKLDGKDARDMFPKEMPTPVKFQSNKQFIRKILDSQAKLTADGTEFKPFDQMPPDYPTFQYQKAVNGNDIPPSEMIIRRHIEDKGGEYRLETEGPHPVPEWRPAQAAAE